MDLAVVVGNNPTLQFSLASGKISNVERNLGTFSALGGERIHTSEHQIAGRQRMAGCFGLTRSGPIVSTHCVVATPYC